MFRTIQGVIVAAAVVLLDGLAVAAAFKNDRVTSLLIGAAMVGTSALILGAMMDRRLGDAHDSGEIRALRRQLAAHRELAARGRSTE